MQMFNLLLTCSASLKLSLPAESRTIVFGITILAVAIIRPMSQISGASALPFSATGVPSTGTSAFIGTDSGCSSRVARVCRRPTRSFSAWRCLRGIEHKVDITELLGSPRLYLPEQQAHLANQQQRNTTSQSATASTTSQSVKRK